VNSSGIQTDKKEIKNAAGEFVKPPENKFKMKKVKPKKTPKMQSFNCSKRVTLHSPKGHIKKSNSVLEGCVIEHDRANLTSVIPLSKTARAASGSSISNSSNPSNSKLHNPVNMQIDTGRKYMTTSRKPTLSVGEDLTVSRTLHGSNPKVPELPSKTSAHQRQSAVQPAEKGNQRSIQSSNPSARSSKQRTAFPTRMLLFGSAETSWNPPQRRGDDPSKAHLPHLKPALTRVVPPKNYSLPTPGPPEPSRLSQLGKIHPEQVKVRSGSVGSERSSPSRSMSFRMMAKAHQGRPEQAENSPCSKPRSEDSSPAMLPLEVQMVNDTIDLDSVSSDVHTLSREYEQYFQHVDKPRKAGIQQTRRVAGLTRAITVRPSSPILASPQSPATPKRALAESLAKLDITADSSAGSPMSNVSMNCGEQLTTPDLTERNRSDVDNTNLAQANSEPTGPVEDRLERVLGVDDGKEISEPVIFAPRGYPKAVTKKHVRNVIDAPSTNPRDGSLALFRRQPSADFTKLVTLFNSERRGGGKDLLEVVRALQGITDKAVQYLGRKGKTEAFHRVLSYVHQAVCDSSPELAPRFRQNLRRIGVSLPVTIPIVGKVPAPQKKFGISGEISEAKQQRSRREKEREIVEQWRELQRVLDSAGSMLPSKKVEGGARSSEARQGDEKVSRRLVPPVTLNLRSIRSKQIRVPGHIANIKQRAIPPGNNIHQTFYETIVPPLRPHDGAEETLKLARPFFGERETSIGTSSVGEQHLREMLQADRSIGFGDSFRSAVLDEPTRGSQPHDHAETARVRQTDLGPGCKADEIEGELEKKNFPNLLALEELTLDQARLLLREAFGTNTAPLQAKPLQSDVDFLRGTEERPPHPHDPRSNYTHRVHRIKMRKLRKSSTRSARASVDNDDENPTGQGLGGMFYPLVASHRDWKPTHRVRQPSGAKTARSAASNSRMDSVLHMKALHGRCSKGSRSAPPTARKKSAGAIPSGGGRHRARSKGQSDPWTSKAVKRIPMERLRRVQETCRSMHREGRSRIHYTDFQRYLHQCGVGGLTPTLVRSLWKAAGADNRGNLRYERLEVKLKGAEKTASRQGALSSGRAPRAMNRAGSTSLQALKKSLSKHLMNTVGRNAVR